MLDGGKRDVTAMTAGRRLATHRLAVAAVQCNHHAQRLAAVQQNPNCQSPALIALGRSELAFMSAQAGAPSACAQQEATHALSARRSRPFPPISSLAPDALVTPAWQVRIMSGFLRQRRNRCFAWAYAHRASPLARALCAIFAHATNAENFVDLLNWSSLRFLICLRASTNSEAAPFADALRQEPCHPERACANGTADSDSNRGHASIGTVWSVSKLALTWPLSLLLTIPALAPSQQPITSCLLLVKNAVVCLSATANKRLCSRFRSRRSSRISQNYKPFKTSKN